MQAAACGLQPAGRSSMRMAVVAGREQNRQARDGCLSNRAAQLSSERAPRRWRGAAEHAAARPNVRPGCRIPIRLRIVGHATLGAALRVRSARRRDNQSAPIIGGAANPRDCAPSIAHMSDGVGPCATGRVLRGMTGRASGRGSRECRGASRARGWTVGAYAGWLRARKRVRPCAVPLVEVEPHTGMGQCRRMGLMRQ